MTEPALQDGLRPDGLRRVAIDPVTRVEGHGKVTLLLDAQHRVRQVRLHIVEFRGFERFVRGRPYWEMPVIVQRLCGICPVSHHLAASRALDAVASADPVPPAADKLRRLMHHGQVLQSHALHFFMLAGPDLLLGFDSEPVRRNLVGVAQSHPEIARQGVALRRFGQEIVRATAGKREHGTGSVPGGMNRHLAPEDREALRRELPAMRGAAEGAVDLARTLHAQDPALYEQFGHCPATMLSLVGAGGAMELYQGRVRARRADGSVLLDDVDEGDFLAGVEEEVRPWTYMKFPYLRALGPEAGWWRVGPLSRIQACDAIPTPRAEARRREFCADGAPRHGVLLSHWARMIELLHCVEVIEGLLDDPELLSGTLRAPATAPAVPREGLAILEAPRGTLIHQYGVGADDLVTYCNLIVSTTQNNEPMNVAIRQVCDRYLEGREITEGLLNRVEIALRAFDPCLSCATHALGQMPLDVRLVGAQGELLDRVLKSADGTLVRCAG